MLHFSRDRLEIDGFYYPGGRIDLRNFHANSCSRHTAVESYHGTVRVVFEISVYAVVRYRKY
ncbi:MAG: hypothetical protein ACUVUR_05140 [bacterium]